MTSSAAYVAWKSWERGTFGHCDEEHAAYYAHELRACGIAAVDGLNIGEVGFGNGTFAGWARRRGSRWTGREVIPELQDRARQAGYEVIESDCTFATAVSGQFNLMVALDVLEHLAIEEIRSFLAEASASLKRGGLLVIRLPGGDSPFSGAIYRGDLTHRTLLGSSAARQLAQEAGFGIVQIRPPVLPLRGVGAVRTICRLGLHSIQRLVFGFVKTFLMANRSAVVSPDMIVVPQNDLQPN